MLAPAPIEVERSRIRHITTGMIRNDGDVVAYLVLVRPAFERIKGVAYSQVRRPGNTAIHAVRVEQLRVGVISRVACIVPDYVNPRVRRH